MRCIQSRLCTSREPLAEKSARAVRRGAVGNTDRLCAGRLPYFILSVIGTKAEAEEIKTAIGAFLKDKLHLEMSASKTLITHSRTEHARFLGYDISVYHADDRLFPRSGTLIKTRNVNGCIRLGILSTHVLPRVMIFRQRSTEKLTKFWHSQYLRKTLRP